MTRSTLADVVRVLGAKPCSDGYVARCPAHEDGNPSLSIAEKDGKLLFRCFTGCDYTAIRAALEARGLTLTADSEPRDLEAGCWTIRDASGRALAQHVRVDRAEGKLVFWRGPAGEKVKLSGLGLRLVDLPLYGTELLAERVDELVVVTEGEKAADAARRLGLLALGTSTGASSAPSPAALAPLKGRTVLLWPDADDEGRRHMERVGRNLRGIVSSVATIAWTAAPPKGDAHDFVARGLKREDFDALVRTDAAVGDPAAVGLRYLHEAAGDALAELDRFADGDLRRYVQTGIRDLDRALGGGLRRGQVTLIGAPTGAGKTTILCGFAVSAGTGAAALVVSPEMSVAELAEREIVRRAAVSKWTRNPWKRRPERDRAGAAHARAAADLRSRQPAVLVYDRPAVTMDEISAAADEAKRRHPDLALVAIDYAQEVADTDPRTPRYLTVGAVAQRSVELARRLDVAVVIASQVNAVKEARGPAQYAFRESAILEHKASNVLLFVVDWTTDAATGARVVERAAFKATKCRGGSLFELAVRYQPALYRVSDLQPEEPAERPTPWPTPRAASGDEEVFA